MTSHVFAFQLSPNLKRKEETDCVDFRAFLLPYSSSSSTTDDSAVAKASRRAAKRGDLNVIATAYGNSSQLLYREKKIRPTVFTP